MDLSERLIRARKAAGFETASEAARAIGLAVPTYLGYENGDREPGKAKARRIADFYRINLDWLLTGRGTMRGQAEDWFRDFFKDRDERELTSMKKMLENVFPRQAPPPRKVG